MEKTAEEIVKQLKKELSRELAWYAENIDDQDYIYDMAYEQVGNMGRGFHASLLGMLYDYVPSDKE